MHTISSITLTYNISFIVKPSKLMLFKPLHHKLLWFVVIIFVNLSCQTGKDQFQFYTVTKSNYNNGISVTGYLESQNSDNIICPQLFSDLTILYLTQDGQNVKPNDTLCILEAPEIEGNYTDALKELEIAKAEYNKSVENLALQTTLLESQAKSIETSAQISRLDSIQSEFTTASQRKIIDLEIQKAEIEKEKIENKLRFLKKINKSELAKLKLKIEQSQNSVNRAKEVLDKLVIIAKKEGIVVRVKSWATGENLNEGDIVWGGQPLLTIPELDKMQAKLTLCESDFKRISMDQKVVIHVDAFPNIEMNGKVFRKSGAGRPIEKKSPIKVFEAIVKIDTLTRLLQPGLSLTCDVYLEEIPDTITIPIISLFDEDSSKVVYVKDKDKFIVQKVTVATNSATTAVISKGLKVNDVISIYKPPLNKIK